MSTSIEKVETGFSSVIRAAAMGAIGLLGLATGRTRAAVPALAAGAAVLSSPTRSWPLTPGSPCRCWPPPGCCCSPRSGGTGCDAGAGRPGAAEALAVPAAAQVACGPVVAGLSGTVSLVAVPANLVAVPGDRPGHAVRRRGRGAVPGLAGRGGVRRLDRALAGRWLVLVAPTAPGCRRVRCRGPAGCRAECCSAVLTVAFLVAARRAVVRRLVAVIALGAILGALPVRLLASGWPPPGWMVVACAVGQGDAVVLPAGPGRAVVVDAGPEPNAVDHCLRRLGVRQVVLLVVSHFHADHIGGVAGVFRGRQVGAVIAPDWPEPAAGRAAVAAPAAGARAPCRRSGRGGRTRWVACG